MAQAISVKLNGSGKSFEDLGEKPTVAGLVAALGFRADRVALERNGEIVPRADWPATLIADGDQVELVHFVGGGC
ncbi:MAG: sulfur carrier protein ThiS [Janthinobacterium lividum]